MKGKVWKSGDDFDGNGCHVRVPSRSSLKDAFRGLILHVRPKKSDRSELHSFGTIHAIWGLYMRAHMIAVFSSTSIVLFNLFEMWSARERMQSASTPFCVQQAGIKRWNCWMECNMLGQCPGRMPTDSRTIVHACSIVDVRMFPACRCSVFLEKASFRNRSLIGQVPDVISQNSLMYSLQEDQKWYQALAVLDTCERSSLQTSSVTYGTVLKLCKDSGHFSSKCFF